MNIYCVPLCIKAVRGRSLSSIGRRWYACVDDGEDGVSSYSSHDVRDQRYGVIVVGEQSVQRLRIQANSAFGSVALKILLAARVRVLL